MFEDLLPFERTADGGLLRLKVTPKASKARIGKIENDGEGGLVLKVYVSEPPEDGKANAAVIKLLSKTFKVAKQNFTIEKGLTSRLKVLRITENPDDIILSLRCFL